MAIKAAASRASRMGRISKSLRRQAQSWVQLPLVEIVGGDEAPWWKLGEIEMIWRTKRDASQAVKLSRAINACPQSQTDSMT